jgi:hypothetical protein
MARYPILPESVRSQLAKIEPSEYGRLFYHPCKVILREGRTLDRVYVVGDAAYLSTWGIYPEQDPAKSWCPIQDVVSVEASSSRCQQSMRMKSTKPVNRAWDIAFSQSCFPMGVSRLTYREMRLTLLSIPRAKDRATSWGFCLRLAGTKIQSQHPNTIGVCTRKKIEVMTR